MRFFLSVLALIIPLALGGTATASGWKSIGVPIDDDSKSMLDRYVFFDDATTDKNVVLAKPVLALADVAEWIKASLGQIMTLNGMHYDALIAYNGLLFTPRGYADYIMYLQDAKMGDFLKNNRFKVAAYVEGVPEITSHGIREIVQKNPDNSGKEDKQTLYVWQANAHIILSYLDYRNQPPVTLFPDRDPNKINNRFPVRARLELVRTPMQKDGTLIAINRIRFSTK